MMKYVSSPDCSVVYGDVKLSGGLPVVSGDLASLLMVYEPIKFLRYGAIWA